MWASVQFGAKDFSGSLVDGGNVYLGQAAGIGSQHGPAA